MREANLIGWLSSVLLLATILKQVHKQWRDHSSRGVSIWLYVGQLVAETGFVIYSWLLGSWVFVVTNALLIVSNLIGLGLVLSHRRCPLAECAARAQQLPQRTDVHQISHWHHE